MDIGKERRCIGFTVSTGSHDVLTEKWGLGCVRVPDVTVSRSMNTSAMDALAIRQNQNPFHFSCVSIQCKLELLAFVFS